jgi:hypothetical protein
MLSKQKTWKVWNRRRTTLQLVQQQRRRQQQVTGRIPLPKPGQASQVVQQRLVLLQSLHQQGSARGLLQQLKRLRLVQKRML